MSDEPTLHPAPGLDTPSEPPSEPELEPAAPPSRWEGFLPRFALDRRITVLVLLATVLVVGLVATIAIPLELIPSGFTPPFLSVSVPWQDAPAPEVLEKVLLPLEEELSSVRGLDTISSFATTGFGRIALRFKHGTDMDVAYREVRDRVQRARPFLPDDADRVFLRKDSASNIPVSVLGILIDPGVGDAYDLIQTEVVPRLERIDGVAAVESDGLVDKEVLIEIDRERAEAAGLNIYELAQQLGADNFSLASGEVTSGGKEMLLRSVARYDSIEELERRLVAPSVRLADVATIRYEQPEQEFRVRVNSKPAIALEVLKEGDANTLGTSRAVARTVEEMRENPRLSGLQIELIMDQGDMIMESLDTLLDSGKLGGVMAAAVLLFFLRRVRLTLIIALSIPLSILLALTVMYFAGETLNILTLLGLMICVGMLVDNSVVVAENIFRLHREGLSRREAVVRGAAEIGLAVVMATLTTVAVFLPVSLVDGEGQFFLLRLSLPISVSLLASLFVALVFVPLSVYLTLPSHQDGAKDRGALGRSFQAVHERANAVLRVGYESTFGRLNSSYERLLAVFLRRRLDLALGVLAVVVLSGAMFATDRVKFVEQDENEQPGFNLWIELPESTSFEEAEAWFLEIEEVLEAKQDELGLEGYFFFHRSTFGQVQGWFHSPPRTDLTPREVTERVVAALPEKPGVVIETGMEDETGEAGTNVHVFTLNGEDPDQLERTAEELEELFVAVPGVLGLQGSGRETAPNELALVVDRDRAQRQQVDPEAIAGVVGYALRGQQLPRFHRDGREIDVRVRFEEEDREQLSQLGTFAVPTATGELVSLASLTDTEVLQSAEVIRRLDKQLARTITLELEEGEEEAARQRLIARAAGIDLPEGVSFGGGGELPGMDEDAAALLWALGVSVLFIYLLMGFLFESFILPLSIMTTIPLAFIGVVWSHVAAGRHIDMLGIIGLVLLVGVVVNNGIVLIDYANRLRKAGHGRTEALLLASSRRFRPIMMTALTTIFGMIPLAVGQPSSIGLSYKSFGLTLIGGLGAATLLTMLVVPIAYTVFEDLRILLVGAVRRRR
ncbi:MAG TPA: efflux RND transporter permease subunit, partial [Thermoanaerobaculia bacterium]|nr:efflux RND transporter permease subunit [Thermoanaerobaculia bacterium]